VLQAFNATTRQALSRLAITYPTTFNSCELDNLQKTVRRAWQRAMHEAPAGNVSEQEIKITTPLAIDEAAAAGFFFLYKKVFGVHGLLRFEYAYPQGFNLLLYDCGGGTIDIAIVHAVVELDGTDRILKVQVRGRSGMRDFGGDNITTEIFRLLKARLAHALPNAGKALESWPTNPEPDTDAALEKLGELLNSYLERNSEQFDIQVPTRFDDRRDHVGDLEVRERRKLTLELWSEAEKIKQKLQTLEEYEYVPQLGGAFRTQQPKVKIQRREVNSLVLGPLLRSVKKANYLIYHKLTVKGEDVDCVAVAGSASRYPLVRELLESELDAAHNPRVNAESIFAVRAGAPTAALAPAALNWEDIFTDVLLEIDDNELKNAVAKGAVLALQKTTVVAGKSRVAFTTDMCECLPYDVGCKDAVIEDYNRLFAEGERYADCAVVASRKSVILPARTAGMRFVEIFRHWPGDKRTSTDGQIKDYWEKYMIFPFAADPPTSLFLRYDNDNHVFFLDDASSQRHEGYEAIPEALYYSPVQRGDL
jgi:hypothetical protein